MDISKGRYWDKPWGLVSSCSRCSEGCRNCWALAMEKRFHKGIEGQIVTHPERLDIPLRTRKPTVWAIWNDLYHEDVPDDFRDDAYAVMHGCDRHTYLILTKRADNLLRYSQTHFLPGYQGRDHIWHGLTICNQDEADAKIPELLRVPGKKFISYEPALGPVDFSQITEDDNMGLPTQIWPLHCAKGINAVVLGGETGPGARPMHPDWVRSVRDQCQAAGVPFFFKQWGKWGLGKDHPDRITKGTNTGCVSPVNGEDNALHRNAAVMVKVGSKRAGRLLDGREWNELPWRKELI